MTSELDKTRGLYHKFNVVRTDGTSEPGKRHEGCCYFVLDCTHDRYALPALRAYAAACEAEYRLLSRDIIVMLDEADARGFAWTRTDG
jgi:hypothetical protein